MGSINKGPWKAACKKRFKNHPEGYEMEMAKLVSEWEERIGDQNYHPYENVEVSEDNWKVIPVLSSCPVSLIFFSGLLKRMQICTYKFFRKCSPS